MSWDAPSTVLPAALRPWGAGHLAEVVSVSDPQNLGRVQVRLLGFDGVGDHDAPVWARVASPFAGSSRGGFFIPDVGDEVLVVFAGGDPRTPIVVGGLWNGNAKPPESLGGDRVDRWAIVSKAGSKISIVEQQQPTIQFETPGGVRGTLTDEGGGKVEIFAAGTTITIDSAGVSVQTPGQLKVQSSGVEITAPTVTVNAATANFSGIVQCNVLQTSSVISASYTPGAGNVW